MNNTRVRVVVEVYLSMFKLKKVGELEKIIMLVILFYGKDDLMIDLSLSMMFIERANIADKYFEWVDDVFYDFCYEKFMFDYICEDIIVWCIVCVNGLVFKKFGDK